MLQTERSETILKCLSENNILTIDKAVEITDSSPATIRRDLAHLDNMGLLKRVRGGAKLLNEQVDGSTPFLLRELQFSTQKKIIAQKAASLIKADSVIFVDGGTTTYCMAPFLSQIKAKIITNSFRLAVAIEKHRTNSSQYTLYLTGGRLSRTDGLLIGPNAKKSIEQYHADIAFISVGGITLKGTYNTNDTVVQSENAMIDNAEKVVILADHSKIGKKAMCHVATLDKINTLITNYWPENEGFYKEIIGTNLELIICK